MTSRGVEHGAEPAEKPADSVFMVKEASLLDY
jgi:hypothetical protein